jgi:chitinase
VGGRRGRLQGREDASLERLHALPGQPAGAAWLFDGTTFWTFDDPPVMAAKADYVKRNRLGGIMFWELSGDTPDV